MTGFNHTIAGSVIALTLHQPALIIPAAFLSHFLLDAAPHYGGDQRLTPFNSYFKRYLALDAMMCVGVLLTAITLSPSNWFLLCIGAFFATLPDFSWLLMYRPPAKLRWFYSFHAKIQWAEVPHGWIYESIYFVLGMTLLVSLTLAQ